MMPPSSLRRMSRSTTTSVPHDADVEHVDAGVREAARPGLRECWLDAADVAADRDLRCGLTNAA